MTEFINQLKFLISVTYWQYIYHKCMVMSGLIAQWWRIPNLTSLEICYVFDKWVEKFYHAIFIGSKWPLFFYWAFYDPPPQLHCDGWCNFCGGRYNYTRVTQQEYLNTKRLSLYIQVIFQEAIQCESMAVIK